MATISPFRGIRFDPGIVDFGAVLAPPYDVIGDRMQENLYANDLRNIVRIDYGKTYADDISGGNDQYTRAKGHLDAFMTLGILKQDKDPSLYIVEHEFRDPSGKTRLRTGVMATIPAKPWDRAEIRPHERTLQKAKDDRMALLRATATQTSPVFGMWHPQTEASAHIAEVTRSGPSAQGSFRGENGAERVRMWAIRNPEDIGAISESLTATTLYIADGHHRYETTVTYGANNVLMYLCAADDPSLEIFPTHRLIHTDFVGAAPQQFDAHQVTSIEAGLEEMTAVRVSHHAFAVVTADHITVVRRPRRPSLSPRDGLDVVVLESELLEPMFHVTPESIQSGTLTFSRDVATAQREVKDGIANAAVICNPCTIDELIAVSDAGEVMPQKSTYFYPKVPTGIVLLGAD